MGQLQIRNIPSAARHNTGLQLRPTLRFPAVNGSAERVMLKSRREKADHTPSEIPYRRSRASRRQIHLPPDRNAGRHGL